MARSPHEVFEDHLQLRLGTHDRLEEDLARNFAEDITVITNYGIFHGKDGVRRCAAILKEQLPCAEYQYLQTTVEGNCAYLVWSGRCDSFYVEGGTDTFVIEDGLIKYQTIYYVVRQD